MHKLDIYIWSLKNYNLKNYKWIECMKILIVENNRLIVCEKGCKFVSSEEYKLRRV